MNIPGLLAPSLKDLLWVLKTLSAEIAFQIVRLGHARVCTRTATFHDIRTGNLMD